MDDSLKKFRDRLRITIILFVFSEPIENLDDDIVSEFKVETKIQAIDFLLRYPDFFSRELIKLLDEDSRINKFEVQQIVKDIFANREPELRVEEMEKFFHGAYESIDDVIAFLVSVGFIKYESKRRRDGKEYEKAYYLTRLGKERIENNLKSIPTVTWYFERCELIKKHLNHFSGTQLKKRQYKYVEEYAEIPYNGKIKQLQEKVKAIYYEKFKEVLV